MLIALLVVAVVILFLTGMVLLLWGAALHRDRNRLFCEYRDLTRKLMHTVGFFRSRCSSETWDEFGREHRAQFPHRETFL